MKNIGPKKKLCEEKNRDKNGFGKCGYHLNNSRFLKVPDTTKSVLQKKMRNDTFKCSKFSLYLRKTTF